MNRPATLIHPASFTAPSGSLSPAEERPENACETMALVRVAKMMFSTLDEGSEGRILGSVDKVELEGIDEGFVRRKYSRRHTSVLQ